MEEESKPVEMFQCTKDQYDHREELEPKELNSDPLINIENQSTNQQ